MSEYEVIFDVLHKVRIHAEKYDLRAVLEGVKLAEEAALAEICRVDLENHGKGYDTLLDIFSSISQVVKH
jgi:hypothetical protein